MEEITFWVCTRRAPCLYRYNNIYKKKNDEAQCSKFRKDSEPSVAEELPLPKKKKKWRLLEDQSISSEGQQNVYFEKSQNRYQRSWCSSSSKTRSDRSDVDFNIKIKSFRNKSKLSKLPQNIHNKTKFATSTPNPNTLRRSLRKTQQNHRVNQLDSSLEIFSSNVNGGQKPLKIENSDGKNKSDIRNHTASSKRGTVLKEQSKNEIVPNGHLDDVSDVSGFTANYIRSTKLHSKTPRKGSNKPSRNLVRQSQQELQKEDTTIECENKSGDIELPTILIQSTDSSPNLTNLVSVNNNNNEKILKIDQGPSEQKLLETKHDEIKDNSEEIVQNINVSFQSKSSGISRYPKRQRNNSKVTTQDLENSNQISTSLKKKVSRELKSINQNSADISLVSRTRSGKQIGVIPVDLQVTCSNNVVGEVSSSVNKNLKASPSKSVGKRKRNTLAKYTSRKKKAVVKGQEITKDSESDGAKKNPGDSKSSLSTSKYVQPPEDKTRPLKKYSSRENSGFAACFSDSEEDKPLIRKKFFC